MTPTRSALGWGVALLTLGGVILLRNVGAFPQRISAWPLALLAAGVALAAHTASQPRHSSYTLPVALSAVGAFFVLRDLGAWPAGVTLGPLLLIVAGLLLILATRPGIWRTKRTDRTDEEGESGSLALDGAREARLELRYGAGTLRLGAGAAPGRLFQGRFVGGVVQEVRPSASRLEVTLRHPMEFERWLRRWRPLDWTIALNDAVALDLRVNTGASRVRLDLSQTAVRHLELNTGASDVEVVTPARAHSTIKIEAGAADVRVRVPDGVAATIRNRSALAGVDIDTDRFPGGAGVYRSGGYDEAERRVDVEIGGGVASFSVR